MLIFSSSFGSNVNGSMYLVYGIESSELGPGFSVVSYISSIKLGSTIMSSLDTGSSYVSGSIALSNSDRTKEDDGRIVLNKIITFSSVGGF